MIHKLLISTFFVLSFFGFAQAQKSKPVQNVTSKKDLTHLRCWAGEHPINNDSKPAKNFLDLPEIKQPLIQLFGAKGYQRVLRDTQMVVPMEMIDGFLVLHSNTGKTQYETEQVIVAVNIFSKVLHVGFSNEQKTEWFSSDAKSQYPTNPPIEIKIKIDEDAAKEWYREMCQIYGCGR